MKLPITLPRILSPSGKGGAGRLVAIFCIGFVGVSGLVYVVSGHRTPLPTSRSAATPDINALPGGTNSDPEQNRLGLETAREGAQRALQSGRSYTPSMAAGSPTRPTEEPGQSVTPSVPPKPNDVHVAKVTRPPPVQTDRRFTVAPGDPDGSGAIRPAAFQQQQDPNAGKAYADAIGKLMDGWSARQPETVVQIESAPPTPASQVTDGPRQAASVADAPVSTSAVAERMSVANSGVLIPAGRGVYAHTVVAVDSDTGGPIILQADSGPIRGDRLIGTFAKAGGNENLLVVQVEKVVHNGAELPADGFLVAPRTMQTAVASWVDQHYISRFLLPAAAAFVQGLGSAIETTSNSVAQIGPLGNTTYATSLNFPQQVGVGAGAAAQRIGSALQQQAPTGPTVHLNANADVGVMFLSDLKTST